MVSRLTATLVTFVMLPGLADAQFIKTFGRGGNDVGTGTAVDGKGDIYVVGWFSNVVDFDPDNVVEGDTKSSGNAAALFLTKYSASGVLRFVKVLGSSPNPNDIHVAADGAGNVVVSGRFQGTNVDFDPDHQVEGDTKSAGAGGNLFAAKYGPDGTLHFVKTIGGEGAKEGGYPAIDPAGNVYVTGSFAGTADFDRDAFVPGDTKMASGLDAFLVKYSSTGVLQFVKQIGGPSNDNSGGVAVSPSGDVYVVGGFTGGAVDFDSDSTSPSDLRGVQGADDAFVARYSSTGVLRSVKTFGNRGGDTAHGVAVDAQGNVYVVGHFMLGVNFDTDNTVPGGYKEAVGGDTGYDAYVVKYNSDGVLQFVKTFGGPSGDDAEHVTVSPSGVVTIAGLIKGKQIDFDTDNSVEGDRRGDYSDLTMTYIASYGATGVLEFVTAFGPGMPIRGVSAGPDGETCATGSFYYHDLDPDHVTAGDIRMASGSGVDVFLLKYSRRWALPVEEETRLSGDVSVEVWGREVRFVIGKGQPVRVELFNVLGQRVAMLYDAEAPEGQMQTVEVPGSLRAGVYLARVKGRTFAETAHVVVH